MNVSMIPVDGRRDGAILAMSQFFHGNLLGCLDDPTPAERADIAHAAELTATLQIWQNGTHHPDADTSWLTLEQFCALNRDLQDILARLARAARRAMIFANAAAFDETAASALAEIAGNQTRQ